MIGGSPNSSGLSEKSECVDDIEAGRADPSTKNQTSMTEGDTTQANDSKAVTCQGIEINHKRVKRDVKKQCPCNQSTKRTVWIQCAICYQWFHSGCVSLGGLSSEMIRALNQWKCFKCFIPRFAIDDFKPPVKSENSQPNISTTHRMSENDDPNVASKDDKSDCYITDVMSSDHNYEHRQTDSRNEKGQVVVSGQLCVTFNEVVIQKGDGIKPSVPVTINSADATHQIHEKMLTENLGVPFKEVVKEETIENTTDISNTSFSNYNPHSEKFTDVSKTTDSQKDVKTAEYGRIFSAHEKVTGYVISASRPKTRKRSSYQKYTTLKSRTQKENSAASSNYFNVIFDDGIKHEVPRTSYDGVNDEIAGERNEKVKTSTRPEFILEPRGGGELYAASRLGDVIKKKFPLPTIDQLECDTFGPYARKSAIMKPNDCEDMSLANEELNITFDDVLNYTDVCKKCELLTTVKSKVKKKSSSKVSTATTIIEKVC